MSESGAVSARDSSARLEEALADNANLRRHASSVAHDFNNLLAVITGYTEMMLKRLRADDPLRRNAEAIKRATEWGSALAQQILSGSRRGAPAPVPVDLNQLVGNVTRVLQPLLGEAIELVTRLSPSLARVSANPHRIGQVIMNLVVNARDAMPSGGRLTIETSNVGGAGSTFKIYLPRVPETAAPAETSAAPAIPAAPAPEVRTVLVVENEREVRDLIREILQLQNYVVLEAGDRDEALAFSAQHAGRIDLMVVDVGIPPSFADEWVVRVRASRPEIKVLYVSGYLSETASANAPKLGPLLQKPFTVGAFTKAIGLVLGRPK